ncbi:MAG: hypothetical protein ACRCWQ_04660 [Bacilli bacterium]
MSPQCKVGFIYVEVLIGLVFLLMSVTYFIGQWLLYAESNRIQEERAYAHYILSEAISAWRFTENEKVLQSKTKIGSYQFVVSKTEDKLCVIEIEHLPNEKWCLELAQK